MKNKTRIYFLAMTGFWLVFGLITIFYPALMNLFQTAEGISAVTPYSDHIWKHDGFDILSICVLLFAVSRETPSRNLLRAGATVASLVAIAIAVSMITTSYWNMLFLVPGVSCLAFAVWGFVLAGQAESK